MRPKLAVVVGCALALVGASRGDEVPPPVVTALEKADRWEVLSLEPYTPAAAPAEQFRGWEVVGKATVTDAKVRAKLLDALKDGAKAYKDEDSARRCFNPRHGIRVRHEGKTLEVVICFSCEKARAYVGGRGR